MAATLGGGGAVPQPGATATGHSPLPVPPILELGAPTSASSAFLAPRLSFPCLKLACRLAARSSPSSSGELPQYRTL